MSFSLGAMSKATRWDTLLESVRADLSNNSSVVIATTETSNSDAERLRTLVASAGGDAPRRLERMGRGVAAVQSVVVGLLLRQLLAHLTGFEASSMELQTGAHGKPFLAAPNRGPHFNVSHSSSCGLIALSNRFEIGVDIETVAGYKERVARRILAPEEFEELDRLDESERTRLFYEIWVIKEACVKATGMGLRTPLRDVAVGLGAAEGRWGSVRWELLDVSDDACACIALVSGSAVIDQHLYFVDAIEALTLDR
jgi:phosphopantetheine--protein transferase-like protein